MDLLHQLEASGLAISVTERGTLRAVGDDASLDKWSPLIREHKVDLINLLAAWADLESAINACCDVRGDSELNREALIADCRNEPADAWSWFAWYFRQETMKWTH